MNLREEKSVQGCCLSSAFNSIPLPLQQHPTASFGNSYEVPNKKKKSNLHCVSYLYKPCKLVKNSLKWCKNSSFKVENFNIFEEGATPPLHPPSGCGEAGKRHQGKILGDGNNEKRRKWFSPFLIFNFNK